MNRFLLVLVSFICVCCSSADNLDDESNNGKATIYGMISDYTTGNTVPQATVELYKSAIISNILMDLVATSVTGTDGVYSFPNIKVEPSSNQYTIIVSHPQYKSYSRILRLNYGSELSVNVALEPK